MVPCLLPIPLCLAETGLSVERFVPLIHSHCLLEWRRIIFHQCIRRRCCHLNGCCLNVFRDSETYILRDFQFKPGQKVSCCVNRSGNLCNCELTLQHIVTCIPQRWWNWFGLEKSRDWFVVCRNDGKFCCFR